MLVESGVPQSDLNERLHLMTARILSRPRLSRIIDDLGLYKDEASYMRFHLTVAQNGLIGGR